MPPTVVAPEVPEIVLEPSDRAPGLARRFVAEQFREREISDDSDVRVVVSELVTNSWVHGAGPIVVRVLRDEHDGRPVIEVQDGGEGQPAIQPEDDATCGRGLLLVSQLAVEWGTRPLLEGGKVTWAKC